MSNTRKFNRQLVPVSKIDLDLNNSRFDSPAKNQDDAVKKIIELNRTSSGNKVIKLAQHIIQHGFNPAEQVILFASGSSGRYLDKEGNRRICAMKLLKKPSILPVDFLEKKRFETLAKQIKQKKITLDDPFCVIFEDEAVADLWVNVMHTGDNDGYGKIKWGSKEIENHKARIKGKKSNLLQLRDFIEQSEFTTPEMRTVFRKMPHTNFERLLSSDDIRKQFGIKFDKEGLFLIAPEEEVVTAIYRVAFDFVGNPDEAARKKVADIYTKEKRGQYIEGIKSILPKNTIEPQKVDIEISDEPNEPLSLPKRGKVRIKKRKGMIPTGLIPEWATEKIRQVMIELEQIDFKNFPIASSVLFRIFFETILSAYLAKSGHLQNMKRRKIEILKEEYIKKNDSASGFDAKKCINFSIWPQLNEMMDYLASSDILSANPGALRALEEFKRKNSDKLIHIDSLNFYTHNHTSSIPDRETLFQYWQELEDVFAILLSRIPSMTENENT